MAVTTVFGAVYAGSIPATPTFTLLMPFRPMARHCSLEAAILVRIGEGQFFWCAGIRQ